MAVIDPIELLKEILEFYGHTDVNSDQIESRALSATEYVFLREIGGGTAHIGRSYQPVIEVVVYAKAIPPATDGFKESRKRSHQIQLDLRSAWGQPFDNGGIHRVITRLAPYRQDIPGLPYGVGRTVAQYEFVLTNSEKWV
jgi:hypothetical protein